MNGVLFNKFYTVAFVIGGHVNGLAEWKPEDGKALKKIENNEGDK